MIRYARIYAFARGWLVKKKILLIINHSESHLERLLHKEKNVNIVGYLAPFEQKSTFDYLGTIGQHAKIIQEEDIDEIVTLSHDLPYELRKTLFEYCQIHGITYRYVSNPYETSKNNTHVDFLGQVPLVEIRTIGITAW